MRNLIHKLSARIPTRIGRAVRGNQRGAAMMEMAVVSPLLIVILIGMVDLGRSAYEAIEIENAAHAGASYGAQNRKHAIDQIGIRNAAIADIGELVDKRRIEVTSERYCECPGGERIDCEKKSCDILGVVKPLVYVHVEIDKTFQTLFPYPGFPTSIPLSRETHMRVE